MVAAISGSVPVTESGDDARGGLAGDLGGVPLQRLEVQVLCGVGLDAVALEQRGHVVGHHLAGVEVGVVRSIVGVRRRLLRKHVHAGGSGIRVGQRDEADHAVASAHTIGRTIMSFRCLRIS